MATWDFIEKLELLDPKEFSEIARKLELAGTPAQPRFAPPQEKKNIKHKN